MRHHAVLLFSLLFLATGCITPRAINEADAHKKMGLAYIHDRNDPAAIGELRQSVKKNRWDEEAWQLLGLAYFSYERYDEAEAAFFRALKLKPDFAQVHVNLGSLYIQNGRFDDAVDVLQTAVDNAEYREPARARHNLAYALFSKGDLPEARKLYVSVLRSFPQFCPGLHGLGMVDEAEGLLTDALGRYRQALECDPRDLKVRLSLGTVEARLDLLANACENLAMVKEADPYGDLRSDAATLLERLDCEAVSRL
ncbi:MAG: tetratricopeptide repeat protein [Deltaproteobacteria bacterium]|nr:tetratricopeptide repeat protein [Deltaproteobacteria bacterium]